MTVTDPFAQLDLADRAIPARPTYQAPARPARTREQVRQIVATAAARIGATVLESDLGFSVQLGNSRVDVVLSRTETLAPNYILDTRETIAALESAREEIRAARLAPVPVIAPADPDAVLFDLADFDAVLAAPAPRVIEEGRRRGALASRLVPALEAHTPEGCTWRVQWGPEKIQLRLERGNYYAPIGSFRILGVGEREWVDVGHRLMGAGAIRNQNHALGRTVPDALVPAVEALEAALSASQEAA